MGNTIGWGVADGSWPRSTVGREELGEMVLKGRGEFSRLVQARTCVKDAESGVVGISSVQSVNKPFSDPKAVLVVVHMKLEGGEERCDGGRARAVVAHLCQHVEEATTQKPVVSGRVHGAAGEGLWSFSVHVWCGTEADGVTRGVALALALETGAMLRGDLDVESWSKRKARAVLAEQFERQLVPSWALAAAAQRDDYVGNAFLTELLPSLRLRPGVGRVPLGLPLAPAKATAATLPGLGLLNLSSITDDCKADEERERRRDKLQRYERECSEIIPGKLFLASEMVAKNEQQLEKNSITHVLNCAGAVCPNYFDDKLAYCALHLNDTEVVDISCLFLTALEFIEKSMQEGRLLVHCQQGVSRSATMVMAYMMWKDGLNFDQALAQLRERRPVCRPNLGFSLQLKQWDQLLTKTVSLPVIGRIITHSDGLYALKSVKKAKTEELDHSSPYVVRGEECVWVWQPANCRSDMREAAMHYVSLQQRYLDAPQDVRSCIAGEEPADFSALLARSHSR